MGWSAAVLLYLAGLSLCFALVQSSEKNDREFRERMAGKDVWGGRGCVIAWVVIAWPMLGLMLLFWRPAKRG